VAESVNDKIHDKLIEHDVKMRRVDGGRQKRAEARLDQMADDLKGLMAKIDPFGTERRDARERRLKKLDKEAAKIIAEAYADISRATADDMKRLARTESEMIVKTIAEELP
jgi:regulator of protease activity HflC (stomatin/prohibitin superfamily)